MSLTEIRSEIDAIDTELVKLFNKRMDCAKRVASAKKKDGIPPVSEIREREILERVTDMADEDVKRYCKMLFSTIIDISKAYQREFYDGGEIEKLAESATSEGKRELPIRATVAIQGIAGAYSESAATKLFDVPSITYFRAFDGVFQAVSGGLCKYGVLPIENSSAGSVSAVYDAMQKYKFSIVKSLRLRVNHCLIGSKEADPKHIKEIVSHEQALTQCSSFIASLGTGVKVTVAENTAIASEAVKKSGRTDIFALSSALCADLYGLKVFKQGVQNSDNNYTRFVCIAKNMEVYEGANRISIMVTLPHERGSLYHLLSKFAALDINLLKIESRPIPGSDFEFMFYFDFEASLKDKRVVRLLSEIKSGNRQFALLGNYSEIV